MRVRAGDMLLALACAALAGFFGLLFAGARAAFRADGCDRMPAEAAEAAAGCADAEVAMWLAGAVALVWALALCALIWRIRHV
ncbi:MAG: hypothetical protein N2422_08445 [Rhodobacteraceae bacterium]|nr:hypothetical protein [Paracoccaceae bacterium]